MKKNNLLFHLFIIIFSWSCNDSRKNEFYLPAEWEAQKGMIITAPEDSIPLEMIRILSKEMKVYCYIVDSTKEFYTKRFVAAGIPIDSIHFMISPSGFSYAARDGLLFMKNKNGEQRLINFQWNSYGWYFEQEYKDYIERDKAKRKLYTSIYHETFPSTLINSSMVNEGGAIETNGEGTIIQVESVNMQRNPHMNKQQQEDSLKKILNAKKIIWLKEGVADDPFGWGVLITKNYFGIGVSGHVDEFCRFVNKSTILLSYPDSLEAENDPVKKITLQRMKINYEILKNATDQDGNPFTVIKMPLPDINYMTFALDTTSKNEEQKFLSLRILDNYKQFSSGDTVHFVPASSYLNFLITNNTVLQAKYWQEGMPETLKEKDEAVKTTLQQFFPERKIIQLNPVSLNHNGGGIHCWSMQVPK